jgi:predicted PurR-regulated permease PerM
MQQSLENRFFLLILGVISAAFILIIMPFWGAIFWAIALTVLFFPLYDWIRVKFGDRRSLASIATLLIAFVLVAVPLTLITLQIISEARDLYDAFQDGDIEPEDVMDNLSKALPFLPGLLDSLDIDVDNLGTQLREALSASSQYIAEEAFKIGRNTVHFMLSMVIMLYLAFFLFRDGPWLSEVVGKAIPLGEKRENTLSKRFVKVTRATMKSSFIVAAVEGLLGGAILALLGVPAAALWGVLIALFSLIPGIGAFLVWVPIAIYLFMTGEVARAVILTAFGSIVIGLIDNFLRPMLVGRDVRLPDYLILLSILGGLGVFGVHGFIIGPIVAAFFVTCWNIFMTDFNKNESP